MGRRLIAWWVRRHIVPCLTSVVTVLLFAAPSAIAQTDTQGNDPSSQTLGDLFGGVQVPGLDSLPFSDLQTGDGWRQATATLRGTSTTVVVFRPGSASNNVIAVIPAAFRLADFVPLPDRSPLDDVTFSDVAFLFVAPGDTRLRIATDDLPPALTKYVAAGSESITANQGLNIFGRADVGGSDAVKSVLSVVGATGTRFALDGSLPSGLFAAELADASDETKDRILDGVNLTLPVPRMKLSGLPGGGTVKDGRLAITIKKGDRRIVDLGVRGELDIDLKGQKVDFAFDLAFQRVDDTNTDLAITGSSPATVRLALFNVFEVAGLSLAAARKGGQWSLAATGKSSLNGKPVDVTVDVVPGQGGGPRTYSVAVKTPMNVSELLGEAIGVPGLDEAVLSALAISEQFAEAKLAVRNQSASVVFSRPTPQAKVQIAILPDAFKMSTFVAQAANTPLDAATFENVALVWVPRGEGKSQVRVADLPAQVATRLSATAPRLDFKDGLNLFGRMELRPAGRIATLLKQVAETETKLPLRGTLDPAVFRSGGSSSANAILDNLDLHVPLPTLALPGLPGAGSFKDGKLAITGKRDSQNRRVIDIGVEGDLEINLKGQNVGFALEVELDRTTGTDITVAGSSRVPLKIAMFRPFEVTAMTIAATRKGNQWAVAVDGKSTLNNKPIDVTVNVEPGQAGGQHTYVMEVNTALIVSDIVPGLALPGLNDIALEKLVVRNAFADARIKVKGEEADIVYYRTAPQASAQIAILPDAFKISAFVPQAGNTPLDAATFENMALIWVPTGEGKAGVSVAGLQTAVAKKLAATAANLDFKEGVNLFGRMAPNPSGQIATLLKQVGATDLKLPLRGTLDPAVFRSGGGAAVGNAILDNLDLHVPLPAVAIPGFPGAGSFKDGKLAITGKRNAQDQRRIDIGVTGELDIDLKGQKIDFALEVALDRTSGGATDLAIAGTSGTPLKIAMFRSFEIDSLAIAANRKAGQWAVTVDGKSKLDNKAIDVAVQVLPGEGGRRTYALDVETALAVSDIVPAVNLPGLSDLVLEKLVIRNDFADARIKVKGEEADIVYYRTAPAAKAQIAVLPDDFKVSTFIAPLAGTPLDAASFDTMALIWVPKGEGKAGLPVAGLQDKVAKKLAAAGANLDFKDGLNLFGAIDFQPAGQIGSLLTQVGVAQLKLPLSGTIDPAIFRRGGGAQIRNAILDNLDLTLPLPALKPPGLGNFIKFADKGILHLDGANTGGQRSFRFQVKDGLTVSVAGKQVAFDAAFSLEKSGQETTLALAGSTKDTLSLPGFTTFETKTLALDATKKANAWTVGLDATADLHGKAIDFTATLATGQGGSQYDIVINSALTVADFIGGGFAVPGLSEVALEKTEITNTWAGTKIKVKGEEADIVFYRTATGAPMQIAVLPAAFKLSAFIPPLAGTPLDGGTFSDMAFVWVPKGQSGVAPANLQADVKARLEASAKGHAFKDGLNLFGKLAVNASGQIGSLLNTVGVSNLSLPLSGTLDPSLFKKSAASDEVKTALFRSLDITTGLPVPKIPGLPNYVQFKNGTLALKGRVEGGQRSIDVKVAGDLTAKMLSKDVDFAMAIEVDKGASPDVTITGTTEKPVTVSLLHDFTLTGLSFAATRAGGKWDARVESKSTINNKPIDTTAELKAGSGGTLAIKTKLTLADLAPISIPGLSDVEFDSADIAPGFAEFTGKIKGLGTTVTAFRRGPAKKMHVGVTFDEFAVASFIPGAGSTPLKDIDFKSTTLVWVPKGSADNNIQSNTFPVDVATGLTGTGATHALKDGLNLFADLNLHPTGAMASALKTIGISDLKLPLKGALSPAVFHTGAATTEIRNAILDNLDLDVPLPTPSISGMPSTIRFKNGRLVVTGKRDGASREIDVAVLGDIDVKVASKDIAFNFDIDVAKTQGSQADITIHAESTSKLSVPFFHPLDLSDLKLTAARSQGRWSTDVDAKSTLNGKPLDVRVVRDDPSTSHIVVHSAITLADLLPGGAAIPGLTDVEIEGLVIRPQRVEATLEVHKTEMTVDVFRRSGVAKPYIAVSLPKDPVTVATLVPPAKGTPIDDLGLDHASFVWVPKGGAGTVDVAALPLVPQTNIKEAAAAPSLKEGMNVFATLALKSTSKVATLLGKVGIKKDTLPLVGAISPRMFHPGVGGAALKQAVLDSIDFTIPLPKIDVPGLSSVVDVKHTNLAIKGITGGIEVDVTGELDVGLRGKKVAFDYAVDVKKKAGAASDVSINGHTDPKKTISLSILHDFSLSGMSFAMTKETAGWAWQVAAKSEYRSKEIDLSYVHEPKGSGYLAIATKLTLADIVGHSDLPGLSDIQANWIRVHDKTWRVNLAVKGVESYLNVYKPDGASKFNIALSTGDFSPTAFIPGTSTTPLKDITFKGLAFVYNPAQAAETTTAAALPPDIGSSLKGIKGNLSFRPGLNVFGHMDVHPSGEMADLLKKVGISEVNIPLNGKFSPQAFAKNHSAADIKNAILDDLDVKMALPTPHIRALSNFVTFKNGHLRLRGKAPDGTRGVDVGVSGDIDLKVKGKDIAFFIDVEYERAAGGSSELHITGHTDKPWDHPFGVHWVNLESLSLDITDKKAAGGTEFDIAIKAKTTVGSHSNLDVIVDVDEVHGSVKSAWVEIDGPVKLTEIPGIKRIPGANKFEIDTIKASTHGVEADTKLAGNKTDIFLFHGSGWNAILTQENFAFTELIPPLAHTPLKYIKLPFAAVILSEDGLNKAYSELGPIAQDALKDIYSSPSEILRIDKGLAFVAGFHPDHAGAMGKAVKGIGVHTNVMIMGEIGGLFGGPPLVKLVGKLSEAGHPGNMPKFMKFAEGVELDFFLTVLENGPDFDFELGIQVGVNADIHGDHLLFDSRVKIQVMDEGFGIDVEGQMQGTWHKPFGIPGFSVGNVTLEVGTQEDGAIKIGFAGSTSIAGDDFSIAADAELLPEALGAPQAIAFKATASEVDMFFLEEIAFEMVAKKEHLPIKKLPLPRFKNVLFAFATPGAADPDLGIVSEGFAMKGGLDFLGRELGTVDVAIGPQSGITVKGKLDDFDLGPLHAKDNDLDIEIHFTSLPAFHIHSNLEFLGIKERFILDVSATTIAFHAKDKIGPDFEADFDLQLSGIDLNKAKVDPKKADFYIKGSFEAKIADFIRDTAKKEMDTAFAEMNAKFKDGKKKVKAAERKVDGLNTQINAERAKVRRERAAAEHRIESAEHRVNSLKGEISHDWHKYHHCHGWGKYACRAYWGVRARAVEGARDIAEEALRIAESVVAHFPIDLDPRVAALIVARDGASATLHAAELAIDGLEDLDSVLQRALDALAKAVGSALAIDINEAAFAGDLRGIITHDEPVDLTLDATLWGARLNETFAFKMKDLPYDIEQLGLMGLYALEHLFEKGLKGLTNGFKHHAHATIGRRIDAKQAARNRELAKYKTDFTKYNQQAKVIQEKAAEFTDAYTKSLMARNHSPFDGIGASLTYANEFLEIGHTGLCLTNDGGQVKQHPCGQDKKAQQTWSTAPAFDDVVKKKYGYVYMKQGSSCIAPEGKWVSVTKKFDKFTFPIPEFKGDGKLIAKDCGDSKEYFWKVLKHGEGWVHIVNRATNHCLYFGNSNAVPGQAVAEWAPCTGAANQVFRVASDATPKYHAANMIIKNDATGRCWGQIKGNEAVQNLACEKAARFDYLIDVRGYIKFVERTSGLCVQPKAYGIGAQLAYKPCSQLDFQWWATEAIPGGWHIANAQTGFCTSMERSGQSLPNAVQDTCVQQTRDTLAPILDPLSGPIWLDVKTAAFPANRVQFDAAYSIQERSPGFRLKRIQQINAQIAALKAAKSRLAAGREVCIRVPYWRGWTMHWRHECFQEGPNAQAFVKIRQDDVSIKQLQAAEKNKFVPPPEPKWYVCVAPWKGNQVPGVVDNRKCRFSWIDGKVATLSGYKVMFSGRDVEWITNTGNHVPSSSVPVGYVVSKKQVAYSCRALIDNKSYIGWNTDGTYCYVIYRGSVKGVTKFEVMSRNPAAAYKLDLTN